MALDPPMPLSNNLETVKQYCTSSSNIKTTGIIKPESWFIFKNSVAHNRTSLWTFLNLWLFYNLTIFLKNYVHSTLFPDISRLLLLLFLTFFTFQLQKYFILVINNTMFIT